MNMIELIVLACTIASPNDCHEYHVLLQSAESPRTCAMQAQPYLAQWAGEHPAYAIKRWHCAYAGQEGGKI